MSIKLLLDFAIVMSSLFLILVLVPLVLIWLNIIAFLKQVQNELNHQMSDR